MLLNIGDDVLDDLFYAGELIRGVIRIVWEEKKIHVSRPECR